jgi:hypothetical protein
MIHKLIVLLLLHTVFVFSQVNSTNKEKLSFTISSTHLIDPWDGSSLRMGIEKPFDDFVINLEFGKYINTIENYAIKPNVKGFVFNPIIKMKMNTKNNGITEFGGIDYLYKDYSYDTQDSLKIGTVTANKEYRISRKVHAVSIKFIQRQYFNKHLFYDFYFGLGIRFTSSQSNLTAEEKENILNDEYHGATQIENEINKTGNFIRPNFYCGVKFGYSIF